MNKTQSVLAMALCALVFFTGCSDDDIPAIEYIQQGSVQGSITGTASDDKTAIDEQFTYNRYAPSAYYGPYSSLYSVHDDESIDIQIVRQDMQTGGLVTLQLSLDNEQDTSPDYNISITYIKETDKILYFSMSTGSSNVSQLTNFTFNTTTGQVKGDYSISGISNSTNNTATVTGSFDVVVKKIIQ
ncbi:MAG TPA: hypothetical protein VIN08_02425 [Ohtaekwangia sp.]|uniref:hypothetical protein n=1 Tax=Ohtaekwangia sp. TaxID=2066019 RepID=UPI002F929809